MTPSRTALRAALWREPLGLRGHAYDADDLSRRLVVELCLDGWPVDVARADAFAPELADVGDGCYGFGFALPEIASLGGSLDLRVANTGEALGEPLPLAALPAKSGGAGLIEAAGGLRLTGWLPPGPGGEAPVVSLLVDRRVAVRGEARSFRLVRQGDVLRAMASFDLRLPDAYADGRVHGVTAVDGMGRVLAGSPCPALAFPDAAGDALLRAAGLGADDPRSATLRTLVPCSVPFSALAGWERAHPPPPCGPAPRSVAVVLVGGRHEGSIASLEGQRVPRWVALAAPERGGPGRFEPAGVLAALAAEPEIEVVCFALGGTAFRPDGLVRLAAACAAEGGSAVYPDALGTESGRPLPLLWPAFDPERQLEQGFAALAFAAPAAAAAAALRGGADSLYGVFWALRDAAGAEPAHLPEILVTLPPLPEGLGDALAAAAAARVGGRAGVAGRDPATGLPSVHVARAPAAGAPALAVIQPEPTTVRLERLAGLGGVGERLLVTHRPAPAPAGWRNLVVPGPRNPSALRQAALGASTAGRVLLLDAGTEPLDADALTELGGRLADAGVVAAGGLLAREGLVLAAGLVLGPGFDAVLAFAGLPLGAPGYAGALAGARSVGALPAAALLVDRAAAVAVGGFDALRFPEHHAGTDFSLRLRAAGGRLVLAPRAVFAVSAPWRPPPEAGCAAERDALRRLWGEDLLDDPFYHPALNRDAAPFTALAWPPRGRVQRRPRRPGAARLQDRKP